ncbi:hypothetical protein PVC01_050037800 [Plasmodium vivax]|uniref:VIR protein n=1 Tax=Plasmodium vivax TaxID=5855 RepID=A0A1G4H9F8_PLAVI|nr:hypothetical protein PVC01_050037800 [Plasmodium vivax]
MTLFYCKPINEEDTTENEFEPRCGTKIFESFRPNFNRVKNEHLNYIKGINDPILRHIFIYFIQYYIDGFNYFKKSQKSHRSEACKYLNRWLQDKKDLFTHGEKCETKIELWETEIGNLWNMLNKTEYTILDDKKPTLWCEQISLNQKTTYPVELTSLKCEESISRESSSSVPPPQSVEAKCVCPQTVDLETLAQPDHIPETDRTKNLAVTSGFTAAGTLGTLFFLYRFTPMASWFRRTGMNNVGTDLYMDAGAPDGFLSMQNGNGGNNLFYQP